MSELRALDKLVLSRLGHPEWKNATSLTHELHAHKGYAFKSLQTEVYKSLGRLVSRGLVERSHFNYRKTLDALGQDS